MLGGAFFAAIAGFVNLSFLEATRMTLSHMTGTVAKLSEALYRGSEISTGHYFAILLTFIAGATLSGFWVADSHLRPGRRYGFLMLMQGLLLFLACFLYEEALWLSVYVVSFTMGQQNAMASSFKGLVIRTTHMTGILTDLGFLLGASLKKRKVIFWRLNFYLAILAGFFLGGWLALISYEVYKIKNLLFPAFLLIAFGLSYLFWYYSNRLHLKDEQHVES